MTTTPQRKTFYIWTIGCQMNKADSERLASALEMLGLRPVPRPQEADVIVLNSCVVRQSAEDRVVGTLGLVKPLKERRPDRVVALMGCMVGPRVDELRARFPHVDLFMRPQEFRPLINLLGGDWDGCLANLAPLNPRVTTYVPVIHGCDLMCSFCIIPYRRGRQVSRPLDEVRREVETLARRGVKEVTLLGQTVDAYGLDLPDRPDLADLLHAVHDTPGIERIRFLTSHPMFMTERIVRAVAELPKVCEHINIPVQAGHNETLRRMRRNYTVGEYLRIVEMIRRHIPDSAISTDVIVGFCGETEEEFRATYRLLEEVEFDKVHIASYSERPGTIASRKMADDVPPEVKEERKRALEELQESIQRRKNARLVGETVEVLVDGHERGRWRGRTRTDKLVFFQDSRDRYGQLVRVRITKASPWALQGEPVD